MKKSEVIFSDQEANDLYFAEKIKSLTTTDTEAAHRDADKLLCELLRRNGCTKTVKAFEKMEKWYA